MTRPLVLAGSVLAALLMVAVVSVNGRRACQVHDAPYAEFWCNPRADADGAELVRRLARNPADIDALKLYAPLAPPEARGKVVELLASLSPADPDVLRLRASELADSGRWDAAVEPLVLLAEYHASDPAAAVLARIVAAGQWRLLAPHLKPGNRWLDRVLVQLASSGAPVATGTSLVAQAVRTNTISPSTALTYLRDLRKAGDWVDAYSLWVALHPGGVPMLYNAKFDQPFTADGFDWEVQAQSAGARSGAAVERVNSDGHGAVLQVRLTGRRFNTPLLRQYVFLGERRARLEGQYMTRGLRMEQGLAWTARCALSGAVAGRSPALVDSGGLWRPFAADIVPPRGCGPVVSLELETAAAFEAETGGVGQVEFDGFALKTDASR